VTRAKVNVSMPPALAKSARQMSEQTGIPLSVVIQRLLEKWIADGGALPARPPVAESAPAAAPKKGGRTRTSAK
jgi:hypothetical protein